jgi:hypothetical protein
MKSEMDEHKPEKRMELALEIYERYSKVYVGRTDIYDEAGTSERLTLRMREVLKQIGESFYEFTDACALRKDRDQSELEIERWVSSLEKSDKSIIRSNVDAILNPEVEFDTDMNSSEDEE